MKKIFTLLFFALFVIGWSSVNAQLMFDFETWTKRADTCVFTTPEPLNFWGDVNMTAELISSYGIPEVVAQCGPTAEMKNGFQAARMESKEYDMGGYTPDIQGWLHTGSIYLDAQYNVIVDLRVENTQKFGSMKGWYKFTASTAPDVTGGDYCTFFAELYAADSTVLAQAYDTLPPVAEYTEFEIMFEYSDASTDVADMGVYITAGNTVPQFGPYGGKKGAILFLDDLEFTTYVGTEKSLINNRSIQVYQVDMGNSLHVQNAEASIIDIFSITGQRLMSGYIGSTEENISISKLDKGIYLYRITENSTPISTGKFVK